MSDYGYTEMTYLDNEVTVGRRRLDGYIPILNEGREVVHLAPSQIKGLIRELEDGMYMLGQLSDQEYLEIMKRRAA